MALKPRLFWFALFAVILASCGQRPHDYHAESSHNYDAESYNVLADACTNSVIGFRRIMDSQSIFVDTHNSQYPSNWTAHANVEYINKVGGVDVTNLPIRFFCLKNGELRAVVDLGVVYEREQKQFEARMEAVHAQINKIEETKFEADPEPKRKMAALNIQKGQSYTWTYKAGGKVTGVLYALHGDTFVVTSATGQRLVIRVDLLVDEDQQIADKLTHVP